MTNQFLTRLAAAQTEEERSWIVTETLLETLVPELASAVWAVAIPHWFNAPILAALRPELAAEAERLYTELQALSFVEVFPERGYNIHERTRKLMLSHLWQENAEKFRLLSARAAEYFARSSRPEDQIEWLYHLIVVDTKWEGSELWNLAQQWSNNFRRAELESLLKTLLEQVEANRVERPAKAEVCYWQGRAKFRFYQAAEALERYEAALGFYRDIGARLGEANTLKAIGDVLQFLKRSTEALERYEAALGFYRDIGARLGEANTLQAYGQLQEDNTQALAYFQLAQELYSQIGDRYSQGRNLLFIAQAQLGLSQPQDAIASLTLAAEIGAEIDFQPLQQYALEQLAQITNENAHLD
jgi:tetratricopeptide (TPR) repeat protein